MSTSVKRISSDMRGAPTINGTAGTLIPALDALFSTGWGITTPLSVNVAGGIATATLTPGETFQRDAVVLIDGATPSSLNGEARVLSSSNTSIAWATAAADGAATGVITIRYAPQSAWSKLFAGTGKAAYWSTHPQSRSRIVRIDDTGTTTARVRGYETMSDVDTGVGPFPTDAQMSGGGHWFKSAYANATATRYRIICDERFFIIAIAPGAGNTPTHLGAPPRGFGDPIELAPGGDAWTTLLSINQAAQNQASASSFCASTVSGPNGMTVVPRTFSGLGGAVLVDNRPFSGLLNSYSGTDNYFGSLPSTVDGQVKMSRMYSREQGVAAPPRSIIPGVYYIAQGDAANVLSDGDILEGSGDLAGRRLVVIADPASSSLTSIPGGRYLVDITGPWR